MAAYGPAIARIRSLTSESARYQATPATISGGPSEIRSYRMVIARKQDDGTWTVTDESSSVTTNRHIRAARMALLA